MDGNRDPFSPGPSKEDVTQQSGKRQKCEIPLHQQILIFFSVCVLVCVSAFIAVLIINSVSVAEQRAFCREVEAKEKSGKLEGHTKSEPSVQDIYMCHSLKCPFDILQCKTVCPFSYQLDENDCPISCECAGSGIMDGDIQFDEADVPILLDEFGYNDDEQDFDVASRSAGIPRWRRKKNQKKTGPMTITYNLDQDLTSEQVASWMRAVNQLEKNTCVRFKEWKDDEKDYLFVTKTKSPDCTSYIGRKGGRQKIVMGECFSARHVEHMLMHTLGFHHEHKRYDRDGYITIKLENVLKRHKRKFRKSKRRRRQYPTEFDKESVTMFHGYSFSIVEGKTPTILDAETNQPLVVPDKDEFSELDITDINQVYCKDIQPANETTSAQSRGGMGGDFMGFGPFMLKLTGFSWTKWGKWSKCDQTCGEAVRRRYRHCKSRSGFSMASRCPGNRAMTVPCKVVPCPNKSDLKPRWRAWGRFGPCSKTCGTGYKYRNRECSDGEPDGGGCRGTAVQGRRCNTKQCRGSEYNRFDPWTEWSDCSATCGGGRITRYRECKNLSGKRARFCGRAKVDHDGIQYQTKVCLIQSCVKVFQSRSLDWFFDSEASKAVEDPSWFFRSPNQISSSVCDPGDHAQWIVGDFDGNGKSDVLCKNSDGKVNIVVTDQANSLSEVTWQGNLDQCAKDRLYSGDFNGDRTSDVLCVAVDGTEADMLIIPIRNGKPVHPIRVGTLCVEDHWSLYIVDANGDNKDDILCRDKTVEPHKFSKIHLNVLDI